MQRFTSIMNRSTLDLLLCPDCSHGPMTCETFAAEGDRIHEAVLRCASCRRWYRIEHGVADLLPAALRRTEKDAAFVRRHGIEGAAAGSKADEGFKSSQIAFFDGHAESYIKDVVEHPMYAAFNEQYFLPWARQVLNAGDRVLDLGCGTAEVGLTLARQGVRTVGIDISEEMLVAGQRRSEKHGCQDHIDLIAGDAEHPPVRDGTFRAAVFLGALHHLPDPANAIRQAAAKLQAGGAFYSQDPHRSPLRFLFDGLMRIWKLYDEEARQDPLLWEEQLAGWLRDAGLTPAIRLSIYLPPHVFKLLSVRASRGLIRATDRCFGALPFTRRWAGYIIAQGVKPAS